MYARTIVPAAVVALALLASVAFAEELTGSSFLIQNSTINGFGGSGTSSSFSSEMAESEIETYQASSTNFIMEMGPLNFGEAAFATQNWRWYGDAEDETPSDPLANETVSPTDIEQGDEIALRISVAETAGVSRDNVKFRLQFATSSDFSDGGYELAESWQCDGASVWCYGDGGGTDSARISTRLLSDADTCTAGSGVGCGLHIESGTSTSAETHVAAAIAEYSFIIRQASAAINTVYFFRLVDPAGTPIPLQDGESYPSVVSGGSSLNFVISGLGSGVATEGITTGVETTPTVVDFGSLSPGVPTQAAQRLSVSTNGTAGYRVYLYQRQEFLSELSARIDPIDGTNEAPTAWTSGCFTEALGCFGYHSGDDVLDGGVEATRFAANDTYAEATSTPHTIAYHDGPANEQATDIVYKIETLNGQDNGEYTTSLVYIAAPIF